MKKILILLCLMAFFGCKTKKTTARPSIETKATRISMDKVDVEQKKKAYDLGKRVLLTCNTSRFKKFSASEATPEVIKNTTEERLTKTCHNFRQKYGEFKEIRLVEVLRNKKEKLTIYRYKADYSKKIANKELRVMMNDNNQVAAIKSLDWKDSYN
jgi:hypothetical protein